MFWFIPAMDQKLLCCVLYILFQRGYSLHLLDFHIPSPVVRHQDVRLECPFDLGNETLYSVKWYKDGNEFYHYIPLNTPPTRVFPAVGIRVDMNNSSDNVVVLSSVQLASSGVYRCEVSGEAPSFQTVTELAEMMVVALPPEDPQISNDRPRYQVGDVLRTNCTSGPSKPAANLKWMINGESADPKCLKLQKIITDQEGLGVTILGLEFVVRHEHFKRGDMKLKCVASIEGIYGGSSEENVEEERPEGASVLGSRTTVAPVGAAGSRETFLPHVAVVALCCCFTCVIA